ncbi:SHOCT domain-containing protein [Hyphobacterium sp. CCMP332]|nr:SHOCT domain-containing protein [Hyphobacterium sp. CCMP332]
MRFFIAILCLGVFSSCATMFGGSNYVAHVNIKDHRDAEIVHNGRTYGYGYTSILVSRKYADRFAFSAKKEGCQSQEYHFNSKIFRGWSLLGSIIFWTGIAPPGIPLPYGVVLDGATGAWWKPNVAERGIRKGDYKNYYYTVSYDGCPDPVKSTEEVISDEELIKFQKLRELKGLLDQGVISKDEFDTQKRRILEKY